MTSSMGREPGWTLRQRLQIIITLALLPVILVSLFQGVARARLDFANVHDRLLQSAHAVAGGDQNLLAAAEQVLRADCSSRSWTLAMSSRARATPWKRDTSTTGIRARVMITWSRRRSVQPGSRPMLLIGLFGALLADELIGAAVA